jgi:hypothetical protein
MGVFHARFCERYDYELGASNLEYSMDAPLSAAREGFSEGFSFAERSGRVQRRQYNGLGLADNNPAILLREFRTLKQIRRECG